MDLIICSVYRCDTAAERTHAILSTLEVGIGTQLTYTCNKGYKFPDKNKTFDITCMDSAQWSENVPECLGNYNLIEHI